MGDGGRVVGRRAARRRRADDLRRPSRRSASSSDTTSSTGPPIGAGRAHVQLPADLAGKIEAILGLDDRPQAHFHFKQGAPLDDQQLPATGRCRPAARAAARPAPMWPAQVAQLYSFPTGFDGHGQTIGILELGGGYQEAELGGLLRKSRCCSTDCAAVSVDGASNSPGVGDADGEVLLDIEVCGAIAPAPDRRLLPPNTDRGFYDAVSTAVHDTSTTRRSSRSAGADRSDLDAAGASGLRRRLAEAAALGVTVLAAAGDHGAGDAAGTATVHADFPASSPHVVACGGTTLAALTGERARSCGTTGTAGRQAAASARLPGAGLAAEARNAEDAQSGRHGVAGRGVPDVAGERGYRLRLHRARRRPVPSDGRHERGRAALRGAYGAG